LSALALARLPYSPAARGFHAIYRAGEVNHCPGCGRVHWHIGRMLAECAFCSTAMPLEEQRTVSAARVIGFSTRPGVGPLE
jgi:hypothetical protein